ncbi:MAG: zinc metalloprotease HtpX [Candidatus Yanofskybacteria bacterium RIFCSPHIGHO2_02_FULL_50_12]|uniref:Protease HtpX homolog n=1 Tax=Candidatus Yanofskybacteria bacterium RIFCSPHIGHO2_02_FULL_50_12 TaxID=1802685 RepID=A0A1F8FTZ3_9BACT|nr:MAG: zinc metalloprotease HtpX [Candidatus Yanofskybacteria bacterium RIFCSPHIGHO2_02_FULL_50_12]
MANLYTHKDSNIRKTWLLLAVFFVFIIAIGWIFAQAYGSPEILYIAVGISLVMNILSYWYSDKVAIAMSGAKPVSREENQYLYRIVENLCITAGLPVPKLYIIQSPQINAFATGRNPQNAAIAVTTGSLEKLANEELEGVLAHELSHIGNRDILVSTVVVILAGVISILADMFLRMSMFGGSDRESRGGAIALIIGLVAAILAPIAAMLIQLAVSRKREYLADASGALLTRYPEGLANALEKISQDGTRLKHAHNATAHMYISNPFKGKEGYSWFARLFMTHPPLSDRIRVLRQMESSGALPE